MCRVAVDIGIHGTLGGAIVCTQCSWRLGDRWRVAFWCRSSRAMNHFRFLCRWTTALVRCVHVGRCVGEASAQQRNRRRSSSRRSGLKWRWWSLRLRLQYRLTDTADDADLHRRGGGMKPGGGRGNEAESPSHFILFTRLRIGHTALVCIFRDDWTGTAKASARVGCSAGGAERGEPCRVGQCCGMYRNFTIPFYDWNTVETGTYTRKRMYASHWCSWDQKVHGSSSSILAWTRNRMDGHRSRAGQAGHV